MRLLANTIKEVKLGWRSYYFLLVFGLAIAYFLFVTLLLPEDVSTGPDIVFLNAMDDGKMSSETLFESSASNGKTLVAESRIDLDRTMNKRFNSIGIVLKGSTSSPVVELVFQGHESPEVRELLRLSILQLTGVLAMQDNYVIEYLETKETEEEKIPFNKSLLPILLMSEAIMMGMILVFAMIFSEKSQQTIKAYGVTPGKIWEYLGAKVIMLTILGVIFTAILTPLVVGTQADYLQVFLIVILGSVLSTSVALIVASFYDNLSQSLVPMLALNLIFGLPMISFFIPGFSPLYLRILPTYPILFALKNALFRGTSSVGFSSMWLILLEGVVAFSIAVKVYKLRVQRG